MRIILDILEQNIPGLEAGLRGLNVELNSLNLLAKPSLKRAINFRAGATPVIEEDKDSKPFTGKFSNEDEFLTHKKMLETYI